MGYKLLFKFGCRGASEDFFFTLNFSFSTAIKLYSQEVNSVCGIVCWFRASYQSFLCYVFSYDGWRVFITHVPSIIQLPTKLRDYVSHTPNDHLNNFKKSSHFDHFTIKSSPKFTWLSSRNFVAMFLSLSFVWQLDYVLVVQKRKMQKLPLVKYEWYV